MTAETQATDTATNDDQAHWWSRSIQIGAVMAVALLLLGPLGTKFGIWPFTLGLMLMMGAAVLAAIGLIGGLWGFMIARSNGYAADKPLCGIGAVISAVVLGIMAMLVVPATSVPPIHNISTDMLDPPAFNAIVPLRKGANPLAYDEVALGPKQRAAYPDVKTHTTTLGREAALAKSIAVLEDMGLEIVAAPPSGRTVEATFTSFWFGFKDDVVVRIRDASDGTGSLIDVRSVSRVGQSDLGANAARIMEFLLRFGS